MLQELYIKNIALIRELNISFERGLNVLSGETGAGKTIIVDSMSLVLGDRGFKELIRHGEEKGLVEAMFSPEDVQAAEDILNENGIDAEELIVSRELTASGKNTCRINGRMVPLSTLKSIMLHIINLHSQGQHADIFEKKRQLEMLDRYADCSHETENVLSAYSRFQSVKKELESMDTDEKEKKRLIDMLTYQYREIDSASLKKGEEDELLAERLIMRNSERISEGVNISHALLSGEDGALYKLKAAAHALDGISDFGDKYKKIGSAVSDAYYAVEDASFELSDCLEDAVYDEKRLDIIEARLETISSLKRKYGESIDAVLAYSEDAKRKLEQTEHSDEIKSELELRLKKCRAELENACSELSSKRKTAAEKLKTELTCHLVELGMKNASFSVRFDEKRPDRNGSDEIEFYISLNMGEPEKPLAKVASGGEASRIMLAVKNIFASRDDVSTLIFDEIDTGISGNMARIVAGKLANISRERQVICVSHLPQLAAMGDANFEISKTDDEFGAVTTVKKLGRKEKLAEIARLSGGIQSGTATAHAEELLSECDAFKASLK